MTLFRSRDLLHATSRGSVFFRLQGTTSVGGNDKGRSLHLKGTKKQAKQDPSPPIARRHPSSAVEGARRDV